MLDFKTSKALSLGVELELQLVNTRDYNLTRGASDLLQAVKKKQYPGEVKPEITESMIEISTGICSTHAEVLDQLHTLRAVLSDAAEQLNLGIAGGGTHPFQNWSERRIYDAPRYTHLSELYGYLAKQFTVFGQHIHIGMPSGDEAMRMTLLISRYVPHFIALSASSPYSHGADTSFDSSRLNVVNAFPLSGYTPFMRNWSAFQEYFSNMAGYGIVESMKDFYWDIRPKPEYGTIELRISDTPLTVEHAADLAAYAQALAAYLMERRDLQPQQKLELVYNYNRFHACRFGLDAGIIDPVTQDQRPLASELAETLDTVLPYARALGAEEAIQRLRQFTAARSNHARVLREIFDKKGSLADVVRESAAMWMAAPPK
ncbi:MAG TPA: YbdK family carboxylate-amine ligase [Burkholderiales bacterium]|nr:YbdK family carboxylate-amine ligase [Burkholderiales bacterium]